MDNKTESAKDVLIRLAKTDTSSESDGAVIKHIFNKLGFGNEIVVTCGLVYLDPPSRPTSIHHAAQEIIDVLKTKGIQF